MSLTATISLALQATQSSTLDLATPAATHRKTFNDALASGTAADQADRAFSDTRTIAASGTEDLDLAGVLMDAFGAAITFVEVVAILVVAAAGNTNDVVLGNGTAPVIGGPFGAAGANTINVKPGGVFLWYAPVNPALAVTATSADILKVANGGGTTGVTYDIVILGRSA